MSETARNTATTSASARRAEDPDDQISLGVHTASEGRIVVAVGGEVDMLTSPQLRTVVLEQLDTAGAELVVLSLDGISFLGTSGLAVLVEMRDAAIAAGVTLRLACNARRVLRPLTIAGLIPMFDIHDTLGDALAPA
ncbi:anti-sigma factor antagonist [Pseudonocardia sp. GCM10023141]|uniref:anti-sigma factor antagonist n=1 Tax=Pseudonocardia sp. GCM10023141 TaxID=3252653 RepID=UPI0036232B60